MKAYIWGNNQFIAVAENKSDAVKSAISRVKDHPDWVRTIVNTEPIEVPENGARVLYTSWVAT